MSYLFYRWDGGAVPNAPLPPGIVVEAWQPARHGVRRRGVAWWVLDRLRLFASRDFNELRLVRDGRTLHRLIVTPRWYRFPDMAAEDLQLGDLSTAPDARGQGLARAAIAEAHQRFAGRRMWYIVAADNAASIALIERCGYCLVGEGVRTPGPFGRFRLRSAPRD